MMLSSLADVALVAPFSFSDSLAFREELDVTPNDRKRVSEVVDKFGRSLSQQSEPFLLRKFLQQAVIQLLNLGGRAYAGARKGESVRRCGRSLRASRAHRKAC